MAKLIDFEFASIKKRYEALARNTEGVEFPSEKEAKLHASEMNELANNLETSDIWLVHDKVYVLRIGNT